MKSLLIIFFITVAIHLTAAEDTELSANNSTASGRFLSLFSVVRFANAFCYGSNGLNGTCYTSAECSSLGGTASGTCASGFGVCCTICLTVCGKTATVNNTYWGNPNYPSTYSTAGQCSLTVKKCSSNICQIRLDFITFSIANPDETAGTTATQCLYDMFTVSGQSNNVPGICGSNANQHMYLDMTPGTDQFSLNMLLTGTNTSRSWKIRISQIPCGTSYTAPDGCLQWFSSSVGTFSSFNYQFSSTPVVQHLANQDYTICIRMNQGFCGICYQVCDSPSTVPTTSKFLISDTAAGGTVLDVLCLTDWLQIPCATDQQNSGSTVAAGTGCVSRICGGAFSVTKATAVPAPVYSYRKPFEVRVYFNSYDATVKEGIGFCLKYQQLACISG